MFCFLISSLFHLYSFFWGGGSFFAFLGDFIVIEELLKIVPSALIYVEEVVNNRQSYVWCPQILCGVSESNNGIVSTASKLSLIHI